MRKNLILAISILYFFSGCLTPGLAADTPQKHYQIKTRWHKLALDLFPHNFNQDDEDEFIIMHGEQVDVQNLDLTSYFTSFGLKEIPGRKLAHFVTGNLDSMCFFHHRANKDSSIFDLFQ